MLKQVNNPMLTPGKSALTRCMYVAGELQIYQVIHSNDTAISKITHIPMQDYHFLSTSENFSEITQNKLLKNGNSRFLPNFLSFILCISYLISFTYKFF